VADSFGGAHNRRRLRLHRASPAITHFGVGVTTCPSRRRLHRRHARRHPDTVSHFISVSVSASKLNHATRSVAPGSRPCRSMQCSRNWRRHRSISLVLKLDSGVPQSQSGVPQRTWVGRPPCFRIGHNRIPPYLYQKEALFYIVGKFWKRP
jgi:hypothetical protein